MDIKNLKDQLENFIQSLGYELYDLEYKKKSKNSILTIYIDKEDGITIEDCVTVTEKLNPYIDELDPIKEEYFLEVSSAGAEKELRNEKAIKRAINQFIHVETSEQKIEGTLLSFEQGMIELKVNNKILKINYNDVNLIRLAVKF